MKRTRFTEEQIIGILREHEAGAATSDVCRKHGISSATFVTLRRGFQLPTFSAPTIAPSAMSASRDRPRHMTMLPGGGSFARAR